MTDPSIKTSDPAPGRGGPQDTPAAPSRDQEVLRAGYTLTVEDAVAFSHYHWRHWAKRPEQPAHIGWGAPILLGLIGFAGLTKYLGDPTSFPSSLVELLALMLCLVFAFVPCFLIFVLLFGGLIRDYRLRRQIRGNARFFDRKTLAISEEGLTAADPSATLNVLWHAVVRIGADGDRAYFYTSETEAFVLPKRAFADAHVFEEFVHTARHYHEEARRFVKPEGQA